MRGRYAEAGEVMAGDCILLARRPGRPEVVVAVSTLPSGTVALDLLSGERLTYVPTAQVSIRR